MRTDQQVERGVLITGKNSKRYASPAWCFSSPIFLPAHFALGGVTIPRCMVGDLGKEARD